MNSSSPLISILIMIRTTSSYNVSRSAIISIAERVRSILYRRCRSWIFSIISVPHFLIVMRHISYRYNITIIADTYICSFLGSSRIKRSCFIRCALLYSPKFSRPVIVMIIRFLKKSDCLSVLKPILYISIIFINVQFVVVVSYGYSIRIST